MLWDGPGYTCRIDGWVLSVGIKLKGGNVKEEWVN